jgi:hypothetical protein
LHSARAAQGFEGLDCHPEPSSLAPRGPDASDNAIDQKHRMNAGNSRSRGKRPMTYGSKCGSGLTPRTGSEGGHGTKGGNLDGQSPPGRPAAKGRNYAFVRPGAETGNHRLPQLLAVERIRPESDPPGRRAARTESGDASATRTPMESSAAEIISACAPPIAATDSIH